MGDAARSFHYGAVSSFGDSILLRCVGLREFSLYSVGLAVTHKFVGHVFSSVVGLKHLDVAICLVLKLFLERQKICNRFAFVL